MPAQPTNQLPVGPVLVSKAEREKEARRRRRGAVPVRTPAGTAGGGNRWTALDLLSTLATVLFLFGVTGYANATPLGTVEDSLDAFFAEVWDNADEATIASQQTMIEMVRSAHEDARAYAASRAQSSRGRASDLAAPFTLDPQLTPAPTPRATAQPAGQSTSAQPSASGPVLTISTRVPSATLGVRATPTEDARPAPTPTRHVIISTGVSRPPLQDRRTSDESSSSGPSAPALPTSAVLTDIVESQPTRPAGTSVPTPAATQVPIGLPTLGIPTVEPTAEPTLDTPPTTAPATATPAPATPTPGPTTAPTVAPTETPIPTAEPTVVPTETLVPTAEPTTPPTQTTVATVPPTETATPTPPPTSTPTPTPTSVAGSVVIRTDAPATGLLTVANMRPGNCATQTVTVFNAGRLPFQTYTLTTGATGTLSVLWTDQTSGLQLRVRRGTTVLYNGPVAVADLDLASAMQPGDTDTLELSICLPTTAGNAFQGKSQTISITWAASSN